MDQRDIWPETFDLDKGEEAPVKRVKRSDVEVIEQKAKLDRFARNVIICLVLLGVGGAVVLLFGFARTPASALKPVAFDIRGMKIGDAPTTDFLNRIKRPTPGRDFDAVETIDVD